MTTYRRTIRVQIKRTVTLRTTVTRRVMFTPPPMTSIPTRVVNVPPRQISQTSTVRYTPAEREFLDEVREVVEGDVQRERDAFLCHAWADRSGPAASLVASLQEHRVDVWFSETDMVLGKGLMRQLDAGLRVSRVGIVLVTPALLATLQAGGVADQELGALLATRRVIPVLHNVSYEDLRAESPLLAARAGLSTEGSSLAEIAVKIAESVLAVEIS